MHVKLIAFDLDGTLLDDEKRLPEKNLAALQAALGPDTAGLMLILSLQMERKYMICRSSGSSSAPALPRRLR